MEKAGSAFTEGESTGSEILLRCCLPDNMDKEKRVANAFLINDTPTKEHLSLGKTIGGYVSPSPGQQSLH